VPPVVGDFTKETVLKLMLYSLACIPAYDWMIRNPDHSNDEVKPPCGLQCIPMAGCIL